jgi:hypothetical protein
MVATVALRSRRCVVVMLYKSTKILHDHELLATEIGIQPLWICFLDGDRSALKAHMLPKLNISFQARFCPSYTLLAFAKPNP